MIQQRQVCLDMGSTGFRGSHGQTRACLGLLLVLAIIAAWVTSRQFDYDPSVFKPAARGPGPQDQGTPPPGEGLFALGSGKVRAFGPGESFDAETLADKINGRADLYLTAGFKGLRFQRFSLENSRDDWMEVFDYHMSSPRQAFSVYARQRRRDVEPAGFKALSYRSGPAVFFVNGDHYVEVLSAVTSKEMIAAIDDVARRYVDTRPAEGLTLWELEALPRDLRVPGSESLQVSDAFGFGRLDQVFTARYDLEAEGVLAWVSFRENPEQAGELAGAWVAFLVENGGRRVPEPLGVPGARAVEILDTWDLVFHHGPVLAGVHEAASLQTARKLGRMLQESIIEAAR
ncbi:MAG: hypothetical protein ISR64_07915 [Deltaproteobacteria bacterium]|nr:hypothetical protein [Deltaproteobacteria bacterium]